MITLRIRISELPQVQEAARKAPESMLRGMLRGLGRSAALVQAEMTKRVPKGVTGRLQQSIFSEVSRKDLSAFIGVNMQEGHAPYAAAIEKGRAANRGAPPSGFGTGRPNIPLARWAQKKLGFVVDFHNSGTVYRLAKMLREKEQPPHPFIVPALEASERGIVQIFEQEADLVLRSI